MQSLTIHCIFLIDQYYFVEIFFSLRLLNFFLYVSCMLTMIQFMKSIYVSGEVFFL